MDIFDTIQRLLRNEDEVAAKIVALVSQNDVDTIAVNQYDETPAVFTNDDKGKKALADETFGAIKHFLRGKIEGAVDVAWHVSSVRKPLRDMANKAAQKQFDHINQ